MAPFAFTSVERLERLRDATVHLSSLRRSLGLFQGDIRRNRVPTRRPREVLLAAEGPLVFPLQAMRVRHTLQVQKTEPQLPYCSQCCELEPAVLKGARIRNLDGAATWTWEYERQQ